MMDGRRQVPVVLSIALVAALIVAAVALNTIAERIAQRRAEAPVHASVGIVQGATAPIAAEQDVFRTGGDQLALGLVANRQRDAHPRTLRTFRSLREYPGAPPRIPHGFTTDEFRTGACTTCHERGGYSPRFGAYVPITPHPEMVACLQCHVGNDDVTGVDLPSQDPSARCRQCHAPGATRISPVHLNWRPADWPVLATRTPNSGPQPIPHDVHGRGNCLACHAGPSAVAEIRTSHPERANCRQCHVTPVTETDTYARPGSPPVADRRGGTP